MTIPPQDAERLVRLLVWIGGVSTTIVGSWIASKIHVYHGNRNAHLDDLKQKVLIPLRDGLAGDLSRLLACEAPMIQDKWTELSFKEGAPITEEQYCTGSALAVLNPWPRITNAIDQALYQDVKQGHLRELMEKVEIFGAAWGGLVASFQDWVEEMAREILTTSGLKPFDLSVEDSYVMHYRLSVFIYMRLLRLQTRALRKKNQGGQWTLEGTNGAAAMATEQQLDRLTTIMEQVIARHKERAAQLRDRASQLQTLLASLRMEVEIALASRRLRKRCDLVTFF